MRRLISASLCAAIAWTSATAHAEPSVTITMRAQPTSVEVGDMLDLEVRAQVSGARVGDVQLPDLSAFEVVASQTSTPMQFSFGFGQGTHVESTKVHSMRLRALQAGEIKLKPAQVTVGGQVFKSSPVTVYVGAGTGSTTSIDPTEPPPPTPPATAGDAQAFIETEASPTSVFLGQQTTVTVRLYTRVRISGGTIVPRKPAAEGFWTHDLPSDDMGGREVVIDGTLYRMFTLYRFAAFPQRTGTLNIGEAQVEFDTGGFGFFEPTEHITRRAAPTTIEVRELPDPGPKDAPVGRFTIDATLDRTQIRTGDAVTVWATVRGSGNVTAVRPSLQAPAGLRALDPRNEDNLEATENGLRGMRKVEWILVAEQPGNYTIPPFRITYFDPDTNSYQTATSKELHVVAAGNPMAATPRHTPETTASTGTASVKFGPVRNGPLTNTRIRTATVAPWIYPWGLTVPPLLFMLAFIGVGLRARTRRRYAASLRAATHPALQQARREQEAGNATSFYAQVSQALSAALSVKLGEAAAGLTRAQLRTTMQARGLDADLIARVLDELEGADFARFSSAGIQPSELAHCLTRVEALIDRLDHHEDAS